jgi:YgiT-type zinc finger domain-containing protein
MQCILCHGEDIEVTEVREELRIASDIVYVPIRIPVCRTCGERYYDRQTIRFLEEVDQKLREGKAELHAVGKVMMFGLSQGPGVLVPGVLSGPENAMQFA